MEKLSEVVLHKTDTKDVFVEVKCTIESSGDLKISSYTIGQIAQDYVSHDDYEYEVIIDKEYKDTVLLLLIQDRFRSESELTTWLGLKDIPFEVETWP